MRVAISMGLYLGLREQELMHASFNDVNKDDRTFRVKSKPAYGFKVKYSEQHDVAMPSALFKLLDEWQQTRPQTELILGIDDEHTRPNGHLLRWQSMRAYRMQRCTRMRRTYVTTLVESGKMGLPAAMAFAGIVI